MTREQIEQLAEAAYGAWRMGKFIAPWHELPDHRQEPWRRIALKVLTTAVELDQQRRAA